jgi:ubiquitin-protein ligase
LREAHKEQRDERREEESNEKGFSFGDFTSNVGAFMSKLGAAVNNQQQTSADISEGSGSETESVSPTSPARVRKKKMENVSEDDPRWMAANLRHYSILMEYQQIQTRPPEGVYVIPSLKNILEWHGVLFVRQGPFKSGVFKFVVELPADYPESAPKTRFTSKIFHPLVHPNTGVVDISSQFPTWTPGQDYVVLILLFLKRMFYKKEFFNVNPEASEEDGVVRGNPAAANLYRADKRAFQKAVDECVALSQTPDKLASQAKDSPMNFSVTTNPKIDELRDALRTMPGGPEGDIEQQKNAFVDWFFDYFVHTLGDTVEDVDEAAFMSGSEETGGLGAVDEDSDEADMASKSSRRSSRS